MKASKPSSLDENGAARPRWASHRFTPDRFRLVGPSADLDLRVHAVRKDVADVALADRVFAPHYARPLAHGCVVSTAPIFHAPSRSSKAVSELLGGETFAVVDTQGVWAWGYSLHDLYVGYVHLDSLGPVTTPTHIVSRPAALVFTECDIKSPVVGRLPLGVRVCVIGQQDAFLSTHAGFIHCRHLDPVSDVVSDFVEVASRFIGVPYRWGGRSGDGIDCSGLVQLALSFAGVQAPRDSDQQASWIGEPLAFGSPLQRGDLVFLPGHVGIMADDTHLLHANAHWMRVVTEPLADVLMRQPEGRGLTALRRLA